MTFKVRLGNTGQIIECPADRTILAAAVMAGIGFPYGCASGNCGACISQLDSGTVDMLPYGDAALSREQRQEGRTLACRALPRSDVEISWLGRVRTG
jgi:ferredoxin